MHLDVCGLGNALVDALVVMDEREVIHRHALKRGTMHLVSHDRWEEVYGEVKGGSVELHPGGSCANAVSTVALLGGNASFCGLVGEDELGQVYGKKLEEVLGRTHLVSRSAVQTGKCLSLVSSGDAERTMLTDLGGTTELLPADLPVEAIESASWLHITGYLFTGGTVGDAAMEAMDRALHAGTRISLDVGDTFVIDHFRDAIATVIRRYADAVFLNEDEASRLIGGGDAALALHEVGKWSETVVVKLGKRGSLIRHQGDVYPVEARPVPAVDTTGAGDAYAGGFLYGLTRGWPIQACGRLASAVAAMTVGQVGGVIRDREKLQELLPRLAPETAAVAATL
ncbi:MAG: adenosine kinase [Deltaproteobacteria bacterium]|nr:adenosine kinase [Deltaproteobacteria bacterium]